MILIKKDDGLLDPFTEVLIKPSTLLRQGDALFNGKVMTVSESVFKLVGFVESQDELKKIVYNLNITFYGRN